MGNALPYTIDPDVQLLLNDMNHIDETWKWHFFTTLISEIVEDDTDVVTAFFSGVSDSVKNILGIQEKQEKLDDFQQIYQETQNAMKIVKQVEFAWRALREQSQRLNITRNDIEKSVSKIITNKDKDKIYPRDFRLEFAEPLFSELETLLKYSEVSILSKPFIDHILSTLKTKDGVRKFYDISTQGFLRRQELINLLDFFLVIPYSFDTLKKLFALYQYRSKSKINFVEFQNTFWKNIRAIPLLPISTEKIPKEMSTNFKDVVSVKNGEKIVFVSSKSSHYLTPTALVSRAGPWTFVIAQFYDYNAAKVPFAPNMLSEIVPQKNPQNALQLAHLLVRCTEKSEAEYIKFIVILIGPVDKSKRFLVSPSEADNSKFGEIPDDVLGKIAGYCYPNFSLRLVSKRWNLCCGDSLPSKKGVLMSTSSAGDISISKYPHMSSDLISLLVTTQYYNWQSFGSSTHLLLKSFLCNDMDRIFCGASPIHDEISKKSMKEIHDDMNKGNSDLFFALEVHDE